ncbi:MAG: PilT protein-like protein [Candidatus Rokubacteria bacterium CSP1-6]|nr:MAG: PilT protein-like protein [Candidatus Rokubacteria bacterium CSP1-6]
MAGEVLLDTNVLVYAYDRAEPGKQRRALDTLRRLVSSGRGRLSAQVLAEFFQAATSKIRAPLSSADAYGQVAALIRAWPVLPITSLVVLEAARGVRDHRLGYWDAQVWATARLNQIAVVLSEDFADGHVVDGVRFLNPFSRAFDLASIG